MRAEPAPILEDLDSLAGAIAVKRPRRVVLANGCFDPLHVGHARYLDDAKRHGDFLVVAVNDDGSTRRLKGKGRPVIRGEDRARVVASIRCVDAVLILADDTVAGILERLQPAVHAKGTDYTVEAVPERDTAVRLGIETVIAGDSKTHASREIVARVRRPGRGGVSS